jgi:alpha-N-acetylglucosaminidase
MLLFCAAGAQAQDAAWTGAAAGVLQRIIPDHADGFRFQVIAQQDGLDVFELESRNGKITVRGSSVSAMLFGANWYLKYYANAHVSWTGDQLALPASLPPVPKKVRIVSPYKYRYMYNYCTFNYTMAFWTWEDWERELDFLALNGVNLSLAIVGQEAVWRNTLRRLGLTEKEISAFIPGPGFQAWWLMSNLEGWGGPVSQDWIEDRAALQKKILARMRELQMEPVLQGFFSMVPRAMIKKYPRARILETGKWVRFDRPAMIDPTDPFFNQAAAIWYQEQRALYGDTRFFGGDPFHEGGGADVDLAGAGRSIQHAMRAFEPRAIWVLQGWQSNPKKELLDGLDKDKTLILDLFGESNPQWKRRNAFYDFPWVWNVISNFGGNTGMHGALWKVAQHPPEALKSAKKGKLVGIGAMLEASMQDAVLWDLLFEMGWRTEVPDLDAWVVNYAKRRYGKLTPGLEQAWRTLEGTAYGPKDGKRAEPESPFCTRPGINISEDTGKFKREYDQCDFAKAWDLFIADAQKYRGVDTFEHDLVNVSRQALANLGLITLTHLNDAFAKGDKESFEQASDLFLELLEAQDRLLATDAHYLLGDWIDAARALGATPDEKDLFEWNARTQITVWGPRATSESLHEYAHREWSGLLRGLYYERWKVFLNNVTDNFDQYTGRGSESATEEWNGFVEQGNQGGSATRVDPTGIDWFAVEDRWTRGHEPFLATPAGDPVDEARAVYDKYRSVMRSECGK